MMIVDASKLQKMSTEQIKWFVEIGERGLDGSWKGHKLEAQCKQAMKDLKAELKRRKAKK